MDCKEALQWIHEHLDGNLKQAEVLKLKQHLDRCEHCNQLFIELERTEAMVKSMPRHSASDELTDRIMNALPQTPARRLGFDWLRRHPAISVASLFLIVMLSSFLSLWNQDTDMMVKGTDLDQVVIEGNTVRIPIGTTYNGNLVVRGGNVKIDGDVEGDITIVDGSYQMASTAHISGQIQEIDRALSWLWYKVNEFFSMVTQ